MTFAHPYILLFLLAIPPLAWWTWRNHRPAPLRYTAAADLPTTASWRQRYRPLLWWLRWTAVALAVTAVARPQQVGSTQIIRGEGIDIALALDISGSMAALDFEPDNRLTAAKNVIRTFTAARPYDRIGLTVFANQAFVQSPLTVDRVVLDRLLEQVQLAGELGVEDGTAIGMGVATAANMLKNSTAESRVIILLTDGVNNAGRIDPLTAAQAAAALDMTVYTIGMGRPGQVPFPQTTIFGDTVVTMVESELDEETLRRLAEVTDGRYFRAENTEGLRQIYAEINALERSEVEIRTFQQYAELAEWVLWPAVGLLLLELLLRHTWFRTLP